MEKSDSKFLFKKEIPYREFLSVSKILELTVSIVLQDGRTDSILSQVVGKPKEINLAEWIKNDFPLEDVEVEIDDDDYEFFKTVMSATELARLYPYETVFERHEAIFFDMHRAKEIIFLDESGRVDLNSNAFDVDRDATKVRFADFVKFANAAEIDVVYVCHDKSVEQTKVDSKPWLVADPRDPPGKLPWYISARYFARIHVKEDASLASKKQILADKVSKSLASVEIYKRGGKNSFDAGTILKAFSNVSLV